MQVFMIEDNENDFFLVYRLISKMDDVTMQRRESLMEGMAYLRSHPVDVLLLDLGLPDAHGLEALDQLQTEFWALPIIILSAIAADELALEAVRRGAQDYLVKGRIDDQIMTRALRYAIERKRLEERLRRSEELYRTLAHNFPNGSLALFDQNCQYTLVNGLGLAEFGLSREKMEGKTVWEVFSPEVAASAEGRMRAALAGETVTEEITYAGQTIVMNYLPIRDRNGSIICGMIMSQNITRRKQAEAALAAERDLLRTLIENSPDYIFIKDLEGRFVLANSTTAQDVHLTTDEIIGKTVFDLMPPVLAAEIHADDLRVLQSGIPVVNVERKTVSKIVLSTKIPLRDKDGNVTGLMGISRDITRHKYLETQRLELDAERGRIKVLQRFINDMSHDFRTPLTTINNALYLLKKSTDPQKQEVYIKQAQHHIRRMDKLLEEILQMEYLDKGETKFQFAWTDMNTFIPPLIHEYEMLSGAKHITLDFVSESASCNALIDKVEFARVITKLMENAITYTPEGGHITVETHIDTQWVTISLKDTGIGISAGDLPHVFERFYRADDARSSDTGGSGLGLSIVQKIVEAHNGHIDVESVPGAGSKFTIRLPLGN